MLSKNNDIGVLVTEGIRLNPESILETTEDNVGVARVSILNGTTTPLAGGATYTGTWENVSSFASIVLGCSTTAGVSGTVTAQFSQDGSTVSESAGPWEFDTSGTIGVPKGLVPTAKWFRVVVSNTDSDPQLALGLQVLLHPSAKISIPTSRPEQSIDDNSDLINTRSILTGQQPSGNYANVRVTSENHLAVAVREPLTAFGELVTISPTPRVALDFVYGLINTDTETLLSGTTGAQATVNRALLSCECGTALGGYAVVRSRRLVRYRPGQATRIRFTAAFPTGIINYLGAAGAFNTEDALLVAQHGSTFGLLRRIAGAAHITRLTVTAGSSGVETVTVRLNGVNFSFATSGVLSTQALAHAIAANGSAYTGWTSSVSPQANGSTVTFIQGTPGATSGTFTLTSTGTAAGTFATLQTGIANDSTTGFIPQTQWNVDRLDGSNSVYNPSGILLDPTKLNVYELNIPYLGGGPISLRILGPHGTFVLCHRIEYPNAYTVPSFKNPTFRIGWISSSLGSTTNKTVTGASCAGFIDGLLTSVRDPYAAKNINYAATTTEGIALAVRVRGEYSNLLNFRENIMQQINAACETANRIINCRIVLNPTIVGTPVWSYVDQSNSSSEYTTTTGLTVTGGREISAFGTSGDGRLDLSALDLRMEPGDVIAICVATATSTATAAVSINWQER